MKMRLVSARAVLGASGLVLVPYALGCASSKVCTAPASVTSADVVVYGGTPAGVAAAVAAARHGSTVILVEPGEHVGGMCSGGLSFSDEREPGNIGGFAKEFFAAILTRYVNENGVTSKQVMTALNGMKFEPHVAEETFRALLSQTCGINVAYKSSLQSVSKTGARIDRLLTTDGRAFSGRVFIDATYTGDLMAAAGVTYAVGREAQTTYNEPFAGVQSPEYVFPAGISSTDDSGGLLPYVQPDQLAPPGSADKKVEAYCYRLCLTQRPDIFGEIPEPDGYDEKNYELLVRYLASMPAAQFTDIFSVIHIPNGKADVNTAGLFSSDMIGASWSYADGAAGDRAAIETQHRGYTQGLLYFLAHSERVAASIQMEAASWGLATDEFTDNDSWPYQLYIREARRMVGQYVMTEQNAETETSQPDAIAVASYIFDSHHVQRVVLPNGQIANEGGLNGYAAKAFSIPYRSILPVRSEASNLLVPVALSASHVLYSAYRIEAYYMHVGQAAGTAASIAVTKRVDASDVSISELQDELKNDGALLVPTPIVNSAP